MPHDLPIVAISGHVLCLRAAGAAGVQGLQRALPSAPSTGGAAHDAGPAGVSVQAPMGDGRAEVARGLARGQLWDGRVPRSGVTSARR